MERFCIQASDLAISPSQYLIDELKKRFEINTSNLHVLPNPYRFKKDQKEISPAHILNNSIYFYGKLSPQKGTFKILEEFKLLWDKGFKEVFTMIGGQDIVFQPESKTMGEIVKTQYADYIKHGLLKLKDKISPNERESVLSDSIIFIVPSIVDNLPYVVLELMSLGKIVIVSKQGGQAEIVSDGEDGFVFDFNEPGSFEKKLFKALKSTFEERKQLVEAAIKKIENNYSYEKLSSLKFKLIENIISKNDKREKFTFIRSLGEKPFADISFKKNGVLSVVIPYYNLGAYINEAINSVLNSTHQHIEIIIINDGSDDEASIKELDNFRNHPQIKIIDKQNTGLADSRNKGAELSNGEFLAFLDADDKVAPDYYEKAIKILCHYKNVFFVGAWTQYFGNSKNIWPTFNPEPPLLLTHNMINSSALIYKKEAFLKAGKNDKDFKIGLEDYESVVSMIAYGLNGVAIPEILFYYRVRKNSMIKGVDMQVRANYYNQIKQKHPLLFLNFEKDISSLIEKNSSPLSMDNSTYDDFPFQNVPVLNIIVRRGIQVVKSNSWLKIQVFRIKRIIRRLT
jgi:glycosyltransferase involved in cell wall biosynthesis